MDDPTIESDSDSNSGHKPTSNDKIRCDQDERNEAFTTSMIQIAEPISRRVTRSSSLQSLLDIHKPLSRSLQSLNTSGDINTGISKGRRVKKELTDEQKKKDRERKQRERATKKSNVALPPSLLNTPSASTTRMFYNSSSALLSRANSCYSSIESLDSTPESDAGISKGRRVKKELTDEQKKKDRERKQRERSTKKSDVALPPPLLNTPSLQQHSSIELISDACAEASIRRSLLNPMSSPLHRTNPFYSSLESLDSTTNSINKCKTVKKELTEEQKRRDRERKQRKRSTKKLEGSMSTPSTSKSMNKSINQFVPTPSTQLSFGMTGLDIHSADSADSTDNVSSELRAPKRLYMFAKPTFTPKKPRRKPARNEGENQLDWMKGTGQQSFHNQYFSKEVEASDVDEPMLMNVKTEDDVEDDEIRSNVEMEIDDDQDSVQIISQDELMKMAQWRVERKKKQDEIRMKLPSLTKLPSRIMSAQEKDFTITKNMVPNECNLGDRQICIHCGALTYTFNCCSHGKVRLPSLLVPPRYIVKKLTGDSEADVHFRKEIVKYNNAFAMGSMSYDREITSGTHPYVKVNGSVHHMLSGTSLPSDKTVPLFHQLYKYDVNEAMKYRMMNPVTGNSIMPNIVRNIQVILERENYLVKQYKMSIDITTEMMKCRKPVKNVCVVLRAPHELNISSVHHPGTLSRPRKEVQSLLYTIEPDGGPGKQNMLIRHRQYGGKLESIGYWNPLIDPLGYPLLFPYGNAGFKRGEFKLNEDYEPKETVDEFSNECDVFDDYPFNHLNDEMEKGVEAIDYEAARQRYKEYRREEGEEVSASSCSEYEDDEEVDIGNEEICEEDGLFEQIGSDDDDENEGNSGHFFFEDSSADEEIDQSEKVVRLSTPEPDDVDVELLMRKRVDEWKKREEQLQREMIKKERKLLMKNDKLRSFKELCLEKRAEGSFFYKMFKDQAEIKKVFIDLEFIEMKRQNEIDDLYKMAIVVLNMNPRHIYNEYADNLGKLQEDVDNEIGKLCASKQYRSDEPNINDFRLNYLDPYQFDENAGSDIDDPEDVVQHDVTEEMPKSKREVQPVRCGKGRRENVSRCQHALHQMQIRDPKFHPYLSTLMLGQLYVIDVALRIIRQKNTRGHMIKLRGSQEDTLTYKKHSASSNRKGFNLGYAFEISNDKVGSTAWYRDQFERAMAQMDYTGKPDLFITMTGNPAWVEIDKNKLPHSEWQSNPFLVNDVFHLKKKELLYDVIEEQLFGPVVSFCYSIEFQKRGMPHMHLLVTLQEGHKLDTSAKIDKYIKATIPDEPLSDDSDDEKDRKIRFRNNVVKHMLHTACIGCADGAYCQLRSASNSNRVHTRCTKNFPVPFNTHTSTVDGGKVDYHRPDDGVTFVKTVGRNKTITVDNRWVVPYNPFLLNKYNCHINVEVTTSVDVVKYIYKYIYKGFDKALAQFIEMSEIDDGGAGQPPRTVVHAKKDAKTAVLMPRGLKTTQRQLTDMNERINQELRRYNIEPKNGEKLTAYDEAIMVEVFRQMTASEAAWIIQGNFMSGLSHTVIDLSVHEEGKMPFFFRKGEEELMKKKIEDKQYKSKFVAWFDLNKRDVEARKYTYDEIPLHYRFHVTTTSREWVPYQKSMTRNIARVRPVSPRFLETFAIRLLAMNVRGPQSFADLRTVNGVVFPTAHEAAKAAGLMDSQMEYERCLYEAVEKNVPNRLRSLFATMLLFGGVQDPRALWTEFEASFYDRRLEHNPDRARNAALFHIQYLLSDQGFTLADFNLPECDAIIFLSQRDRDLAIDGVEMNDPRDDRAEAAKMVASLNTDQKKAYDVIMSAVENNGKGREGNCFFLQGSGGCGKTYVYRAIYYHLQSLPNPIPVAMIATTGIAATLLIKGTTAHRKFKLPLNCDEASNSSISFESKAAEELRQTTVLIIDESTMASRFVFKAIHNLLKEIMQVDKPFGGKIILLGGDWKQLLPVVAGASSNDAVFHTLKNDDLWKHFTVLTLSKNMRAQRDPQYATLLENVGNGLVNGIPDNCVRLPTECIASSMDDVVNFIYHDMSLNPQIVAKSCILASLNAETCEINAKVLDMLPGDSRTYMAIDTPKDGIGMQVPPEYFRDDMPSGLPPYELTLKKNCIVILLRNINVSRGLCNGSRLRVEALYDHFIECELLTTDYAGSIVWLTKASVDPPSKGKKNANYSRFQFPLRIAYAMTINKAQGQTFDRVGIILKNNVFSHGQLYVALSRARESANVRLYSASQMDVDGRAVVVVRNMVEYAVLEPLPPGCLIDPDYVEPEYVDVVEEPMNNPSRRSNYVHDHSKSIVLKNIVKEHNTVKKSKKKTV